MVAQKYVDVVDVREIDHFKGEVLNAVVVEIVEATGRKTWPNGLARCLGTTSWKDALVCYIT
jgi:hypothetical protein